jgi:tRNA(fMet)-specific endonuclease VapC
VRYLLDTNIGSDLVRNPHGRITQRIRKVGEEQVCTSIVAAAELRYGRAKKGSARLTAQLDDAPADKNYGMLRARLEQSGKPIGANDLLIAAQALTLGHVLVTDNEREFARVDGLPCENWLR